MADYEFVLDPAEIASALRLTLDETMTAFSDGRVVSRFSEYWGCRLYGLTKHENTNEVDTDAYCPTGDGDVQISMRVLTKGGIRFQGSQYMGKGRKCALQDLKNSLLAVDRVMVCDITKFPAIRLYMLPAVKILRWVDEGLLTASGLTGEKFHRLRKRVEWQQMMGFCEQYADSSGQELTAPIKE